GSAGGSVVDGGEGDSNMRDAIWKVLRGIAAQLGPRYLIFDGQAQAHLDKPGAAGAEAERYRRLVYTLREQAWGLHGTHLRPFVPQGQGQGPGQYYYGAGWGEGPEHHRGMMMQSSVSMGHASGHSGHNGPGGGPPPAPWSVDGHGAGLDYETGDK
ncbi:unnamed protein product, partial [Discosporangium mesarthrocarpum]